MKNYLTLFLLFPLILCCTQSKPVKNVDEGDVKADVYTSKEIGWSIKIPDGWDIISTDKMQVTAEIGKDAIEKTSGTKVDMSSLKNLISFKKNQFNLFSSTSQPFKEAYPGEYLENVKDLNKVIFDTYRSKGIDVDSLSGNAVIGGLAFKTFEIKLFSKDKKRILNQIMFSRLINGFDFGVNINFNNETDRDMMLKAWKESNFAMK
ncbi:hypothetical protein EZJ43_00545 [Pedobacter changchengzhani]|uniref:Uncharacterized protein n=1 Tax=Pedobacter changchengzhani TaxID=2529274 RepID=A0A4R5MP47_9SPHI|nr:hypothetical protein [Pedobacter changchengzhani]TDG37620.1 hypothetical protein EZJ43_00545 [Pedobacter changchengzhani]